MKTDGKTKKYKKTGREKERTQRETGKKEQKYSLVFLLFCVKLYMADLQPAFILKSSNISLTSAANILPSSVAPKVMATR